jgi:hypothetical protein
MSAADGFVAPPPGTARAELERRYRRLLRLYPREFRARRADEMLGVLMASAATGQDRPARGDVGDIVRGSLVMRLRGPRGGWSFALAAFALAAPLFLLLTDILQVAFPYSESLAVVRSRISLLETHGVPAAAIPRSALVAQHIGGPQLLSQGGFLFLVAGQLIVAVAVLAGSRRTALAAAAIAAAADAMRWHSVNTLQAGTGQLAFLTLAVFLLEATALAVADPRAARHRGGWRHAFPALVLAAATQLWVLAFEAARDADVMTAHDGELHVSSGNTVMVAALALTVLAVLLPLPLGLGWRTSLLFAAACYPLVILAAVTRVGPFGWSLGLLPRPLGLGSMPAPEAHTAIVAILFLPPLLVLSWAVARTIRARRTRGSGGLAA